jgi:hypothetical protein
VVRDLNQRKMLQVAALDQRKVEEAPWERERAASVGRRQHSRADWLGMALRLTCTLANVAVFTHGWCATAISLGLVLP